MNKEELYNKYLKKFKIREISYGDGITKYQVLKKKVLFYKVVEDYVDHDWVDEYDKKTAKDLLDEEINKMISRTINTIYEYEAKFMFREKNLLTELEDLIEIL